MQPDIPPHPTCRIHSSICTAGCACSSGSPAATACRARAASCAFCTWASICCTYIISSSGMRGTSACGKDNGYAAMCRVGVQPGIPDVHHPASPCRQGAAPPPAANQLQREAGCIGSLGGRQSRQPVKWAGQQQRATGNKGAPPRILPHRTSLATLITCRRMGGSDCCVTGTLRAPRCAVSTASCGNGHAQSTEHG